MATTEKFAKVLAMDSGDKVGTSRKDSDILDNYAATGAVTISSVLIVGRVPVDATIPSLKLSTDDLGSAGDIDIGFHQIDGKNGLGTVINADAIGDGIDINAAALDNVEQRFVTLDHNTRGQKAWELAGLSARPTYDEMFLTITFVEATTAAGDISVNVKVRK